MADGYSDDIDSFSVDSSVKSESKPPTIISVECLKRGSTKAYQTKTENINMMQNPASDKKIRSSFDSGDQIDNVMSGESLYKTFTFEQSSNEEDVEKCIAFWKSVMQKNLEPIKCSIIESSKAKTPPEPEQKESLDKVNDQNEQIRNAEAKVHEFYKNMWTTTLKELQMRKMNEIRLIGKSRCKMCETQLSGNKSKDSCIDKGEILELNAWEPKLGKSGSVNRFTKSKPSTAAEPLDKLLKIEKTAVCICEPEAQDTVSIDTVISDRRHIPLDTNRYQLIDIIHKKRKTGIYSEWRKGLSKTCTCGIATCDCNKNPAVVSIIPKTVPCRCGHIKCQCKIEVLDETQDQQQEISVDREEIEDTEEPTNYCHCGNKDCTCTKPVFEKESQATMELHVSKLSESMTSNETITLMPDGEVPLTLFDVGPIKKDSKADVTMTAIESGSKFSITTLKSTSESRKCLCEECVCAKEEAKEETEEETEKREKEILQLQKSNKK